MVLNVMRSRKFARRVLLGILILIIPAFVLWGVGNISRKPEPVGEISGKKILPEDFAKSLQGIRIQVLTSYFNDISALNSIMRNRPMLNFMAWERLIMLDESRKRNIRIPDSTVLAFITGHPLFQRNGAFDKQVYEYILRNNLSLDPRKFEELVRQNLMVKAVRNDILKDVAVSDEDVLEFYRIHNDAVDLSYIMLDKDLYSDKVDVTPGEARQYFEINRDKFFEPAKVEAEYIEIPYGDAAERDTVTERLKEIYGEIRDSGDAFLETAGKYGLKSGKTGPFSREEVIPGIAFSKGLQDTVFGIGENEISLPVFTSPEEGAVYIFRKTADIPRKSLTFEEADEIIVSNIREAKSRQKAMERSAEVYEDIVSGGKTLEDAAGELDIAAVSVENVSFSGYIDNVGPAGEIVVRSREKSKGVIAPFMVKNGVIIVRVDAVHQADETAFAGKKDELREKLLARKQMSVIDRWFRERSDKAKLNRPLDQL